MIKEGKTPLCWIQTFYIGDSGGWIHPPHVTSANVSDMTDCRHLFTTFKVRNDWQTTNTHAPPTKYFWWTFTRKARSWKKRLETGHWRH